MARGRTNSAPERRGPEIEALRLTPTLGDFNEDFVKFGAVELSANLRVQLAPEDVTRFVVSKPTLAETS